ncbi:MAG: hypothetical protein RLZZ136_1495 [Pseudomonadota bacterium]
MDKPAIDPNSFRQVLGNYPTGVAVITALDSNGSPVGMVVGTFSSVSLNPPLVGFLPDKRSGSWGLIEQSGRFCVNVLASDQLALCQQLAKPGIDKFAGVDITVSKHNLPVLGDALAVIECRLTDVLEAGDHWFVMGEVITFEVRRQITPLLFFKGQYGSFSPLS